MEHERDDDSEDDSDEDEFVPDVVVDSEEEDEWYSLPNSTIEARVFDLCQPGLGQLKTAGRDGETANIREVRIVGNNDDDDNNHSHEEIQANMQRLRRAFSQFVTLLDRYGREGVHEVSFWSMRFTASDHASFEADDLDRLFGEVLPTLPRLERVMFVGYCVDLEACLMTLATHVTVASSLLDLDIRSSCSGSFLGCVPALADMLRRNVPLQILRLNSKQKLDEEACRQIFGSLQHNTNLQRLHVKVQQVYGDDVMMFPSHPTSALQRLSIEVKAWTYDGKSSFARKLKTNTTLKELCITHNEPSTSLDHQPWMELLKSHNGTLLRLWEYSTVTADESLSHELAVLQLLHRNERIRQALQDLKDYHVSPVALLSRVLEMVSDLPTLLYRFVRLGDVHALSDRLLSRSKHLQSGGSDSNHGNPQKKRSLPPAPPRPRSPRNA